MMDTLELFLSSPLPIYILSPVVFVASLLLLTRAYTQLRYNRRLKQYLRPSHPKGRHIDGQLLPPLQIPYNVPFLGNALRFLSQYPGAFWNYLIITHPLETGVCSLLVGGRKTHIIFSPHAVNALFKDKTLGRDAINRDLAIKAFDLSPEDSNRYWRDPQLHENLHAEFILNMGRVNELTASFTRCMAKRLAADAKKPPFDYVNFYDWLRDRMFTASTNTIMGEKLLAMYPEFGADYAKFDTEVLSFFFRIPRIFMREAYARRERIIKKLEEWNQSVLQQCGEAMDPQNDVPWEPLFGSRLNRARQRYYAESNMDMHGRAGMDLGFVFALSSNSITATGWMLLHILHSPSTKARVIAELQTAHNSDGSLNIPMLVSLPLLQSIWQEVLRLYSDTIVTRDVFHDIKLPLDESGRKVLLGPGLVMAPSWMPHRDPQIWDDQVAPVEVFYAERFLVRDPLSGKDSFTLDGTKGKLIPFGGGKTHCPGRVFAKQEVLVACALVLTSYDFEVKGFVDVNGKQTSSFPTLAPNYLGSSIMIPGGDMVVTIRPKLLR